MKNLNLSKDINLVKKNIFYLLRQNPIFSSILILITIFANFLELTGIGMIFPLMQSILNDGDNILYTKLLSKFITIEDSEKKFKFVFLIFAIILLIKNLVIILKSFLSNEIEVQLRSKFVARISKELVYSDYNSFNQLNNTEIFNLLNNEIKFSIRSLRSFFQLLSSIIFLLFTIGLSLFFSKTIFLFLLIFFLTVIPPLSYFLLKYAVRTSKLRLSISDVLAKVYRNMLDGLKTLKIFNLMEIFMFDLKEKLKINMKVHRNFSFFTETLINYFEILIILLLSAITFYYLYYFDFNELYKSIPFFATFFILIFKIITSSLKILKDGMYVVNYAASLDRLINIYDSLINKRLHKNDKIKKIKFDKLKKNIIISNLNFSYGDKKIFQNANLIINKSDRILLSGPSGCGKSTLIEIICGLISNYQGEIKIDEVNLKNLNHNSWVKKIGYVGQKNFLFNKSIKENILDGAEDKNDNKNYKKIIEVSGIKQFLSESNLKDNLIINHTQDNLSGGQLRRISIARSLIKNPELIILDEATNELDAQLEEDILFNIKKFFSDITIIIISHKKTLSDFCNKKIKIENFMIKDTE